MKALLVAVTLVSTSVLFAPQANAGDPPKCDAKLNYIHKSTSQGTRGKVKVYGSTTCDRPMEVVSVQVKLYKGDVLLGVSPDPIELGKPSIGRSAVGPDCVPATYRATSEHYAKLGAFVFTTSRSQQNWVSCS